MPKFQYLTIEPNRHANDPEGPEAVAVYGHSEYEPHSVLAGQHRRVFLDSFSSVKAARAAYPQAESSGSTYEPLRLPDTPPDWFDPMAAGEEW